MKGLTFNVNLSEEQMDHIAALSADKVNYTLKKLQNNDMWYESKNKQLEQQLNKINELLVSKELMIDRLMNILKRQKQELEKLKVEKQ